MKITIECRTYSIKTKASVATGSQTHNLTEETSSKGWFRRRFANRELVMDQASDTDNLGKKLKTFSLSTIKLQ